MMKSAVNGVSVPAEWAPQKAIWTAWPSSADEWAGDLDSPRRDVANLVRALAPTNKVYVLVNNAEAEQSARTALGAAAELVTAKYGDIWLRDTGPIFAGSADGKIALRFATNSWGGKYDLPDDATVGDDVARVSQTAIKRFDFVLEGGAIDQDWRRHHSDDAADAAQSQSQQLDARTGGSRAGTRVRRQESDLDR